MDLKPSHSDFMAPQNRDSMKKLDRSPHFGSRCEPSSLPGVVQFLRIAPGFDVHLAEKGGLFGVFRAPKKACLHDF